MYHSPINAGRTAHIRKLRKMSDAELLENFYTCLRWINYFQDPDNHYTYRKIYDNVRDEVRRRKLNFTWTRQQAKQYRIEAQKMFFGALSFNELEWKLECLIMYTLPACRNVMRDRMYLVRETIHVILDCMHQHHEVSPLEYNKDLLDALAVPFFSLETAVIAYKILKGLFFLSENILIFFLVLGQIVLSILDPIWRLIDPDYRCLKNILHIILVFVTLAWLSCYVHDGLF